jgi:hypothetical protein
MSFIDLLRKGFGYVLLSMGVSRPGTKPAPRQSAAPKPAPKSGSNGPAA